MRSPDTLCADVTLDQALSRLALDLRELTQSFHAPRFADGVWFAAARERCQVISDQIAELGEAMSESIAERRDALRQSLLEMRDTMQAHAQELADSPTVARAREMRLSIARAYEDFVAELRAMDLVTTDASDDLRPFRAPRRTRTLMHIMMAVLAVVLYELALSRVGALAVLYSLLVLFASLSFTRSWWPLWNDILMDRVFSSISRPRERYKVNSATYYLLALAAIATIAPRPAACLAVLVLGFGDPVASSAGHRWGRLRLRNDKSLVGSLAFLLVASAVTFAYAVVAVPGYGLLAKALLAVSVALVGTVTELFSDRLDDNFTVPVACALYAMLWF